MKRFYSILSMLCLFLGMTLAQTNAPAKFGPTPNERQMKYLQEPMAAFIHFGMNTFAGADGIEWGNDMKRPASTFNPTQGKVDTDQWVRLLKKAGFTRVIITLKHHDGFCTWPTKVTDYNISNSPYLNGQGDLAKELSLSCDKYGMDMGIYLSPWDAWEPSYGDASPGDYNDFYDAQLRELLGGEYGRLNPETGKREIVEIWLDGATGSGAAHQTYDFARYVATTRELQPNCLTWMTLDAAKNYSGSEAGFPVDAFWVGNEAGYVNDPVWMKVTVSGASVNKYTATGQYMSIPEADVSIRPGWFYHTSQDGSVKTLDYLVHNIYFRSVGMGIPLLLNVPPNRAGKFHDNDSIRLMEFGKALSNTFQTNLLTPDMQVTATANRGVGFEPKNVLDENYNTYWTLADDQKTASLTIDLGKDVEMDVIRIQEYLPLGQRISGWKLEVEVYGSWREYGSGQTIGFQRMVKGELLPIRKIRFTVTSSLATPLINGIQAYRSDASITKTGPIPPGINSTEASTLQALVTKKVSKLKFEVLEFPTGKWPTLAEMNFFTTVDGTRTEIDRAGFTATATSEAKQAVNGEPDCLASNTLDGDISTIWQPEWKPKVKMPQSLMYDFGKQIDLTEISYLPRQTSDKDIAKKFNIYIAENPEDDYMLSLEGGAFNEAVKTAQFTPISSTGWKLLPNYSSLGTAIQSQISEATVQLKMQGNWFRLLGAKSPDTGIFEVWVDGTKVATVDTYSATLTKDAVLYESNSLGEGEHIVVVKCTGTKNENSAGESIVLQSFLKFEDEVKGMFEMERTFAESFEDSGTFTFTVRRFGDLSETATVTYITSPGTGVHGKTYLDKTEVLEFGAGESEKTATITIIDNDVAEGNKDFYIELNTPTNDHILGFNKTLRILVYDNDGDFSNSNLEGYCEPGGTQHPEKKAYLESATTEGAKKNFSYAVAQSPDQVYVKFLDDYIEAERGSTFTLKLNAYKAGESTTTVLQDLRYNVAYIYADWDADLKFSDSERIAKVGFRNTEFAANGTNNVKANYDYVLNISQEIAVPAFAVLQNIPIRVIYQQAWKDMPNGACTSVHEGMIYDFKLKVLDKGTSLKRTEANKFYVFVSNDKVLCKGDFEAGTTVNIIGLTGSVISTSHILSNQTNTELNISHLPKGIYLVTIQSKGKVETHKISKF
ncbi:MAG TPA: T9SS type A sorting domain-containing protein [Bacteroidales bacterium]|nr:T9SS type A sorting domain-containing protein [Bacteroidales bacterium]